MGVRVFGLRYVRCVSAACLGRHGPQVVGTDINGEKVALINGAASPIVAPPLSKGAPWAPTGLHRGPAAHAVVLGRTEVLLIGHAGTGARRALSTIRLGEEVIDLTRGAARPKDTPGPTASAG